MRKGIAVFTLFISAAALARPESTGASVEKGQAAVRSWLAQTDAGRYGDSWESASVLFRAAVTRPLWEKTMTDTRTPLGAVSRRSLKSATFTRTLPGAPEGEYVIVQYDTDFEKRPGSVETVTAVHEKDGSWKSGGYFIK